MSIVQKELQKIAGELSPADIEFCKEEAQKIADLSPKMFAKVFTSLYIVNLLGAEEAGYYKTVSGPGAAKTNIVWKETNYAMPIPTSEFESNPSSGMVQTPGY